MYIYRRTRAQTNAYLETQKVREERRRLKEQKLRKKLRKAKKKVNMCSVVTFHFINIPSLSILF